MLAFALLGHECYERKETIVMRLLAIVYGPFQFLSNTRKKKSNTHINVNKQYYNFIHMAVMCELVLYVPSEYTMYPCSQAVCDLVIKTLI